MRNYYEFREICGYSDDDKFRENIDKLGETDRLIFMGKLEGKTHTSIGRELGITHERIRQRLEEICDRLEQMRRVTNTSDRTFEERLEDDPSCLNIGMWIVDKIKSYDPTLTVGDLAYMRDWQLKKIPRFGYQSRKHLRRAINLYLEG